MTHIQNKFTDVLNYIDLHLDDELSIEQLSEIAHLSKYHFHRQFSSYYGISLSAYIKLIRLKRASYQLAFRKSLKVIDIALSSGYESPEAFSKAFSQAIGQSPSKFRQSPDWNCWHNKYESLTSMRVKIRDDKVNDFKVEIVNFLDINLAVLEHKCAPQMLPNTINNFIRWRKENKLPPSKNRTFNLVYDDPALVSPENYKFDICTSIKGSVKENNYGIINKNIPSGPCAVIRHIGSDDTLKNAVNYLYDVWLSSQKRELRNFPLFFERIHFFPEVAENEMVTDIYLPLK